MHRPGLERLQSSCYILSISCAASRLSEGHAAAPQGPMIDDPLLLNDWHAVAWASEVRDTEPTAIRLLENDLVLWRNRDGIHVWRDLCVHRGSRLSAGHLTNNRLACPYHGWEYDSAGRCVRIPAHPDQPPPARAHAA